MERVGGRVQKVTMCVFLKVCVRNVRAQSKRVFAFERRACVCVCIGVCVPVKMCATGVI